MMFLGASKALLLIAMGIGYIVLYLAKREEKGLQFLGYIIGIVIVILGALFIVTSLTVPDMGRPAMMQQRMMPPPPAR